MDTIDFSIETAIEAAEALQRTLARRTHRKKVMGQEVIRPGQLGEALRLPSILAKLRSKQARRREEGLEDFQTLWPTLSSATHEKVLDEMEWYDPRSLDWDDPRSNRRPAPPEN
ncbi:hypothetical protein EZI54_09785 [Marinobacter halodurans]|uniref:Uncharacterized protein n=1 Tax=Marinobacter halodurans TaxID=2528979 RepID=A0ABY1ZKS1_9GAMM|nr:hypothetical protein [Marinobacter halodurans]TBW56226.1 hypothetical protein EZI54_09785 [Marinobacter halodurans]